MKLDLGHGLDIKITTAEKICDIWTENQKKQLSRDLDFVIRTCFQKMREDELQAYILDFFSVAGGDFRRHVILIKDGTKIVAVTSFDAGRCRKNGKDYVGMYNIVRAILPEYRASGITGKINRWILDEFSPDIMFSNAYHSGTLHAWVGLSDKGHESHDFYPRLTAGTLLTVPRTNMDFVISMFRKLYILLVKDREELDREIRNLTPNMVRRNTHDGVYDYNPWAANGRKDALAEALGLTEKDGVLVVAMKKNLFEQQ